MTCPTPVTRAGGFTLVELLVAMTLVATLTAGGLAAFARANTTWRAQAADQRRYERAQYVFGTLEPDIQMAGYFGIARPTSALPTSAIPGSVSACGVDVIARLDVPVERRTALPAACVPRATMPGAAMYCWYAALLQKFPPRAPGGRNGSPRAIRSSRAASSAMARCLQMPRIPNFANCWCASTTWRAPPMAIPARPHCG